MNVTINYFKETIESEKGTIPVFRQRIVAHNKSIHTMVVTGNGLVSTSALNIIHVWDPQVIITFFHLLTFSRHV
jgi:hypothetical protein